MNLRDMITNPPGSHTRQVAARYMIREALEAKYRETMSQPLLRARYGASVHRAGDAYLVWVRVPSMVLPVDFDVVFRLVFPEGVRSVLGAEAQVYCNSPAWVMTVGYVAVKRGLIVPGWEGALGRAAREAPSVTNADEQYGFDKTTFRAILWLTGAGGFLTRADLDRGADLDRRRAPPSPADPSLSAEAKLFAYSRAQALETERKRHDRERDRRAKEAQVKANELASKKKAKSAKSSKTTRQAGSVRSVGSVRQKKNQ